MRQGETDEFIQAGIESFGRTDAEAADAEILARSVEAVKAAGVRDIEIRLGDTGLFNALLNMVMRNTVGCMLSVVAIIATTMVSVASLTQMVLATSAKLTIT